MAKTTRPSCDMCEQEAVQQFSTDSGTITRCDDHQVPQADRGTAWVQNF